MVSRRSAHPTYNESAERARGATFSVATGCELQHGEWKTAEGGRDSLDHPPPGQPTSGNGLLLNRHPGRDLEAVGVFQAGNNGGSIVAEPHAHGVPGGGATLDSGVQCSSVRFTQLDAIHFIVPGEDVGQSRHDVSVPFFADDDAVAWIVLRDGSEHLGEVVSFTLLPALEATVAKLAGVVHKQPVAVGRDRAELSNDAATAGHVVVLLELDSLLTVPRSFDGSHR